jgi:heme/copper-type cytochrome/quinol oxidase subunit 2
MRLSFADGLFWTSVACCVVAQFFIVRSVLSTHHVPEPGASPMPRQRSGLELLWALVPAVALAALLFHTWRAVQRNASPPPPSPVVQLPA